VYLLIINPYGNKHHQPKRTIGLVKEAAKSMKAEKVLSDFSCVLKKVTAGPTTPL
jgi:hypothetical protein